jgi:hypothetical protein
MVVQEANFQVDPHYPELWKYTATGDYMPVSGVYQDGPQSRVGDSAMEENAWNSTILSLASAMMPTHPNAALWRKRAAEYAITATMSKSDSTDTQTVVNGWSLSQWDLLSRTYAGYNVDDNYIVINHNKRNPDYMQAIVLPLTSAVMMATGGQQVPDAMKFNVKNVYGALQTEAFPGGTMYNRARGASVYYPDGVDWGNRRSGGYWAMDSMVDSLVFNDVDTVVPTKASYWAGLHAKDTIAMQNRAGVMPGGQIVLNNTEDAYPGREGWHASQIATAWLAKSMTVNWTDESLG